MAEPSSSAFLMAGRNCSLEATGEVGEHEEAIEVRMEQKVGFAEAHTDAVVEACVLNWALGVRVVGVGSDAGTPHGCDGGGRRGRD